VLAVIVDPGDLIGEPLPVLKPSPPSTRRGGLPGCFLQGFVVLVVVVVCGLGVGLPNTYWHRLGYVQVLEGPDRVVLFVEVNRAMRWPGLIARHSHNFAAAFLRIDVFPDGRIERTTLSSDLEDRLTFNTNLYVVVHLADGFYLLKDAARPVYRLGPDRVDRLSSEEAVRATGNEVLHARTALFDLSRLDAISARRGWRRLNHEPGNGPYLLRSDSIDSTRHGVRLRHTGGWLNPDAPESIIAESFSSTQRWTRTLIEVDTRRWTSYKAPSDRAYLRATYAASPARW
jgi:hypothetical protein